MLNLLMPVFLKKNSEQILLIIKKIAHDLLNNEKGKTHGVLEIQ